MSTAENLTIVRAGFIPLVDCAVLVAAREKGFAAEHGLDLQLCKEVSWANIRDRINIGQFDVAHMLAGMPIAQSLGIGHFKVATIAPMALGVGGNAITVSHALYKALSETKLDLSQPLSAAQALRQVIDKRRGENLEPLSFGQVFPFSCHVAAGLRGIPSAERETMMGVLVRESRLDMEGGLTLLATIGNTAPFIGLFGTVWGIMHALQSLGGAEALSMDMVAGPVAEALVATAAGLFTAIPAVVGYNLLLRQLRRLFGVVDGNAVRMLSRSPETGSA